jgi:Leucine-rich repeat (LRR) protein
MLVDELILCCTTTNGVVEERVKQDANKVIVRRRLLCTPLGSQLTFRLQLCDMGLTELPVELFRMTNVKELFLFVNSLCSLPSEFAQLTALEELGVR